MEIKTFLIPSRVAQSHTTENCVITLTLLGESASMSMSWSLSLEQLTDEQFDMVLTGERNVSAVKNNDNCHYWTAYDNPPQCTLLTVIKHKGALWIGWLCF